MHAHIGSLPDGAAAAAKPAERLISIPYLLLRVSTAGGAFVMGFIQTFVFARVLTPDRFSLFIVVGGIGYTLWLTDLGLAKILFVNLRAGHLAGKPNAQHARQATAVILFYVLLGVVASLACIAIRSAQPSATLRDAMELGLFLLYITLNLAWFSLRSISIAVDVYIFYEKLELTRRVIVVATMLAMLAGLPLIAFLIGADALWAVLLAAAAAKLVRRGALAAQLRGFWHELISFYRQNRGSIVAQRHGRLERGFRRHLSLLFRSDSVRARRRADHSRSDVPHLSRHQRDLFRRLRPHFARTDPRAGRPRRKAARSNDHARGRTLRRARRLRLRAVDFRRRPAL